MRGGDIARVRIDDRERRARLTVRHRLAPSARASSPLEVARSLVALHATGAASVYLAAWARIGEVGVADVDRALFEERTVVRVLGMRRTVFVVPVEVMPVVHGACTRAIAARERRNLERLLVEGGICASGSADAWLRSAEADTMRALEARGEATAAELGSDVSQLRERLHFGEGRRWAGSQGMS
ncbi:MAG TPA: crosslink repair DNA glycosylase YcaQ family protein, partial [Candidatus Binatia bacterium]|nr:crosslink repair DNA glycosylase YcaQ family protein [Candidatus Binatia bacterium]